MNDLSKAELEILADWYDTDSYKIFKKVLDSRRVNIATLALEAQDMAQLNRMQGRAYEDKDLHVFFKGLHKEVKSKK